MIENLEYTQFAQNSVAESQVSSTVNMSRDYRDTLGEGISVTLVGVGVVFVVLIVLILFIDIFKRLEPHIDDFLALFKNKKDVSSVEAQNIDNITLVLISAAVATYTYNRGKITRIRVLPPQSKKGGNWAMQARNVLQLSHSKTKQY